MKGEVEVILTINSRTVPPCASCHSDVAHWTAYDLEQKLGRPLTGADIIDVKVVSTIHDQSTEQRP